MKRKRERRKRYGAKLHQKKAHMRVHVAKEARGEKKMRSALIGKGDSVKVLRGDHKGKGAKVMRVSHLKRMVYLEGISQRNARGVEALVPFEPSNLMITALKERKKPKG